jgi:beta-lactamase class D
MELNSSQQDILAQIQHAVQSSVSREIVYCSEWLGYLPYGAYHWVEVNNDDISKEFPVGWQRSDLHALEQTGFLRKLHEWQNPKDEHHCKITYAVA